MRSVRALEPVNPFRLSPPQAPLRSPLLRQLSPLAEWLLGLDALSRTYAAASEPGADPQLFAGRVLQSFGIDIDVSASELARIPKTGPLVIVANHPFGGVDGLVLMELLRRIRPDAKVMVNHLLKRIPEFEHTCVFVNPFGGPEATRQNVANMRAAMQYVQQGGALGIFPAGEVSSLRVKEGRVADIGWSPTIGRLIRRSGATVVPMYFHGRNSMLFQFAGLVHPRLRTAMLAREMLRRRSQPVKIEVGSAVAPAKLERFASDQEIVDYLYIRTHVLAAREPSTAVMPVQPATQPTTDQPVVPPQPREKLVAEVHALPESQVIVDSSKYQVIYARSAQIPHLLQEIGRLREITFRAVGEGTGRATDLDHYDEHYLHLFVWNREAGEIVGAYRVGLTDEIVAEHGIEGLYTSTLFRYQRKLFEQMNPAVELGRSFVREEYQREYQPLLLLWKGIAGFVARHPKYKRLFGVVSVSRWYQSSTRDLLVAFLKASRLEPELASMVSPLHPPPQSRRALKQVLPPRSTTIHDLDQINELVEEIEADRKGVPVLLRQYIRLNARVLGFNVDPAFSDVLDALMLVDLTQADRSVLSRFFGKHALDIYLAKHGKPAPEAEPAMAQV